MSPLRRWKIGVFLVLGALCLFSVYELVAVRGTFAPSRPLSAAGGNAILVGAPGDRIAGRVYLSGTPSPSAPLVVVLHGDAPFVKPGYQYLFASKLSEMAPGTRVAALLRPGYADPYGAKSDGDRGFATADNYSRNTVDQLAAAIQALRSRWAAPAVILVGHSGGAALAADIAALNPGLLQHVFLVGCPCDVPAFRRHMARLQLGPFWLLPTKSLSPSETLHQMQRGTEVTAISGSEDPIALPQYAEAYVDEARKLGIAASITILPGKGHEILTDPAVLDAVAKAAHQES